MSTRALKDPKFESGLLVVGKDVPRTDAIPKVTGAAQYVADIHMPGMLHAAVLRSPHPHARILSIDTSAARSMPGVKAVVTGEDTAKRKWGAFRPDLYPLAINKVRYVGDEVAAVAAIDPETARAAVDRIVVEYEVLTGVFSLDEAMAPGAALVHDDTPGNVAHEFAFERGDVDAGFKASDVIVEGTWDSIRQWHSSLETIGCVAHWANNRVSMWCNTQTPFLARGRYAIALGVPESQVRVIQTEVGGGFGGKSGDDNGSVIAAILARKSGRPVKLIHTREEEFLASHPRMPMRYWVRLGFSKAGKVLAKEIRMWADNGAYTGKSQAILGAATVRHDALYKYPNARAKSTLLYTNLVPTGAFRGFGNPSADWAVEQAWDLAAEKLKIDVVDLLRLNAVEEGDVSPHNHKITSGELRQCIDKAAELIQWKKKRKARKDGHGLGMGCSIHVNGRRSFGDWDGSSAIVRINEDGRATIITGEGEIGQGTLTVLRQIAAEELGLPYEDVDITRPDTDVHPHSLGALASRVTYVAGNAVKLAANAAHKQLMAAAAEQFKKPAEDLTIINGQIGPKKGAESEFKPVSAVVRANIYKRGGEAIVGVGNWDNPSEFPDHSRYGNESGAYNFAAQAVEVEVDRGTGVVTLKEISAVVDCGTVIHPAAAQGQVEGAVVQGIGLAMTEYFDWHQGTPTDPQYIDYPLPSADFVPKIHVGFADSYEPSGPFGAKGLGEIGLDAIPAAIANAIADAVGVRIHQLPITAEKIHRALHPELYADEKVARAAPPKGGVWTRLATGRPSGTRPFAMELVTPKTVDEAITLYAAGDTAIVSGGMSHALRRERTGFPQAKRLMNVGRIPELLEIINKNNCLRIGSAVNQQTLITLPELRERWAALAEALDAAGHTRVRQMTTVGGSVAPLIGGFDMPVALLALNARVITATPAGRKTRTLAEAFEKRFAKDEMVIAVEVDALPAHSGSAFHKFLPRGVMETPAANAAATVTLDANGKCIAAHLVVGAVSWKPVVPDLSSLKGAAFDEVKIRAAVQAVRDMAQPLANVRGSAMYKRNMAVEIGARTLIRAWQKAMQNK
ncbi:MAG: molybdopterin-dependent oxidoreductase [Burkholderiales bacterium]|jgi:CO/xanthine dehydrogenase Mo-binding subunit/CO/xanthine dehydrogenase FAD-binding subunit|nr:molybdopterin-dependent oxidoreductase [Burkholderiales bacterium]